MTQAIQKTLRDSAGMRWTALLLLAMAMFCSYIFMDILSPIKDLMQETRGWDSTAFGTMQGSEVFLNVFCAFHGSTLCSRDAGRCLYQMVCRE